MEDGNSTKVCYFGEKFSDQAKNSLRNEVCKDLPVEFEHKGKSYCVLHFPDNQKDKNTNFATVLRDRIINQENNFVGVYFPGGIYFREHTFESEVLFDYAYFEEASFDKVIFGKVSFSFADLGSSKFENSTFNDLALFIETIFGTDRFFVSVERLVSFSNTTFSNVHFQDCVFHKMAHFRDVVFQEAGFSRTTFKKGAAFFSAKFNEHAWFDESIFEESTNFDNSIFDCDARAKETAKEKSFIITASFNKAKFQSVVFRHTTFEAIDFREARFDKVQFWESTFNSCAIFEASTFNKLDFYKTKFLNEASFEKAKFQDNGGFFWCEFQDKATFNKAIFDARCDILFNFTAFQKLSEFRSAVINGYLSFNGTDDEKVFLDETDLDLEHIRIEDPEKISFHTVSLRPHWFINIDSRKLNFVNTSWGENLGERKYIVGELKKIEDRRHKNSKELFKITCRQLAENAENNNRFEEASKFRQMAMEIEWFEKKENVKKGREKILTLSQTNVDCPVHSKNFFSKSWCVIKDIWQEIKFSQIVISHRLYRFSSKFGERSGRAFAILLGIVLISAILYISPYCKFDKESKRSLGLVESISYSLRVMVLQRPEPFPENDFAKIVVGFESVFAPLQLALLALALRRKFMR